MSSDVRGVCSWPLFAGRVSLANGCFRWFNLRTQRADECGRIQEATGALRCEGEVTVPRESPHVETCLWLRFGQQGHGHPFSSGVPGPRIHRTHREIHGDVADPVHRGLALDRDLGRPPGAHGGVGVLRRPPKTFRFSNRWTQFSVRPLRWSPSHISSVG